MTAQTCIETCKNGQRVTVVLPQGSSYICCGKLLHEHASDFVHKHEAARLTCVDVDPSIINTLQFRFWHKTIIDKSASVDRFETELFLDLLQNLTRGTARNLVTKIIFPCSHYNFLQQCRGLSEFSKIQTAPRRILRGDITGHV